MRKLLVATTLAVLLTIGQVALAQDVPPAPVAAAGVVVDLRPVVDLAFQGLASLLAGLGSVAMGFLIRKLHLDASAASSTWLHDAIDRALGYALHQARALVDEHGYTSATVKSALVGNAVQYLTSNVPALLQRFGIDPSTLEDLILAHLGQNDAAYIKGADLLAATPAVTAPSAAAAAAAPAS